MLVKELADIAQLTPPSRVGAFSVIALIDVYNICADIPDTRCGLLSGIACVNIICLDC